jgi:hypothetical protein
MISNPASRESFTKSPASRRRPDLFLVGAPKCGTTAMAQYLGAHPDIYMAQKEMHFFGSDLRFGRQFYRRRETEYLAEFDGWNGERRGGEASVWYLLSRCAAAEIKRFNPKARILIMLRQPAQMLHSLYNQFRHDGNEHLRSFEAALGAEDERRAGRGIARQAYFIQGLVYREAARYATQVERYFREFGRERVQVIIYDDLAADPAGVYRGTLKFLDLDTTAGEPDFQVINGSRRGQGSVFRRFLRDPAVFSAAVALGRRLPKRAFEALRRMEARLGESRGAVVRRAPLMPATKTTLKREFTNEIERLSQLLGRDLTHWNK